MTYILLEKQVEISMWLEYVL